MDTEIAEALSGNEMVELFPEFAGNPSQDAEIGSKPEEAATPSEPAAVASDPIEVFKSLAPDKQQEVLKALSPDLRKKVAFAELDSLDEQELERNHRLKSVIHRRAQGNFDKWRAEQERQRAIEQQRTMIERQRDEWLEKDAYELGEELQNSLKESKDFNVKVKPLIDEYSRQAAARAWEEGRQAGYYWAYQELSGSLEELPHWKGMSQDERKSFIGRYPKQAQLIAALIDEGANKKTEAELNKRLKDMQQRQERESHVAARASEPSPDMGAGAPTADADFMAAYAAGRSSDHVRAKRLLDM